jgi:hypothetical protein
MIPTTTFITAMIVLVVVHLAQTAGAVEPPVAPRKTVVSIDGQSFLINGKPTYAGRSYQGMKIEGLLMNARLVQGIFDDSNPQTRAEWNYPDGPWDPDRNTREFIEAMPVWRRHGMIGFTINFQGGSPRGYSREQPWRNSAFETDGALKPAYLARLEKILDRADELGMVPMIGYFYFGQEPHMRDEQAIIKATENATDWLLAKGYTNVLVEIANECDIIYKHEIVKAARGDELIKHVQQRSAGKVNAPAKRLLVSTSMSGGKLASAPIVASADFILLHGNGVRDPARISEMVEQTRAMPQYRGQPIVFNEDDHFDFEKQQNNMLAAVSRYAGWGYFDYRMASEGFDEGFQSVPVNWQISSARKRGFFDLLTTMTQPQQP